jgi:hypothetical protein
MKSHVEADWDHFSCNKVRPLDNNSTNILSLSHAPVDFRNNPNNQSSGHCHGITIHQITCIISYPNHIVKEMNDTSGPSGGVLDHVGGFGYGIGVSIGMLLLITTITLASYCCTRTEQPGAQARQRTAPRPSDDQPQNFVIDVGLDEATILSYPKLLYSEAKINKTDSTATCCSICLADYKSSDMLRLLPDCGHLFHLNCIDPWLRLHPTCPVCRTSPLPTPLSTPLAEVVPLASRRD